MINQLNDEELAVVRQMIPHMQEVIKQAEYTAARRLVMGVWRKWIIGLAGIIGALVVIRSNGKEFLQWIIGT